MPKEDLISQAEQQKANLIAEASQTISILQDAVDLDMATDEERTQLTTLKKYRVLLSRVDTSRRLILTGRQPYKFHPGLSRASSTLSS